MRFPRRKAKTQGWPVDDQASWPVPPRLADRSCCCPARPVVKVLIPPAVSRSHSVDLLLCGHYYRAALAAVGAAVIDQTGAVVDPVPGTRGTRVSRGRQGVRSQA